MPDIDVHKAQKAIEVLWVDSMAQNGWRFNHAEQAQDQKGKVCRTMGYKIHEDDQVIAVAQSLHRDSEGDVLCIPQVAVISRRSIAAKGFDPKKVYPGD